MAGLREELDLDVSAALRSVGQVEAALGSAAKSFRVELAQALDVLRRADTSVRIDADASDVTGSINAAVQNADSSVTIDADSNLGEVAEEAEDVRDNIAAADRASAGLGGTLGGVKAAAAAMVGAFALRSVIEGIRSTVDAASDLEESTSKVRVVFGSSAGEIERWGDTSATSVGLAKQAALEAAGTFGNLFTALGTSREEATKLAPEVVGLASDLASFNNLGVEETLEKIRSGLVGEIEPLRSLGVSFGAVDVEARAMKLGLADANGEISEGAKLQARYSLILDQTKAAQGDFARTSDGLANTQKILAAEMGNARAEIGQAFLPLVLELVAEFRNAIPQVKELALAAGPAMTAGFRAFMPVGTSFLSILTSMGPVLEVVADVLEALPPEVLTAATAFGLLGSGMGPLPNVFRQFASGVSAGTGVLGSFSSGLAAINPYVLAGTVAVTGLTFILGQHQKEQRENEAAIKDATAAFRDQATAIDEDAVALARTRVESKNQIDDLRRLGLSFDELAGQIRGGADGYEEFIRLLIDKGEITISKNGGVIRDSAEAVRIYGSATAAATARGGEFINKNTGLVASFESLQKQYRDGAKVQLDYLVANEEVTEAEVKAAEKRHRLADGTIDYLSVLEDVAPVQEETADATAKGTAKVEDQTDAMEEAEKAINDTIAALDKFLGRQVSGLEATLNFEAAIDDLIGGLKENGRTLDLNTEKGRANQQQLLDTRSAVIDLAKRRYEETGSAEAAAVAVFLHTQRLAAELKQAGLTEKQVRDYIAALHLTPKDVETAITANTAPAIAEVRKLPGAMFREAETAGAQFSDGIKRGMNNNLAPVITAARGIAAAAIAAAKDAFQSRSPSRVGIEIGGFFVAGLVIGIDQQKVNAENAARAMAGGVSDVMREAAKVTTSEALTILQAVARVKDAETNLAEVRKKKGRTALDLRIAELELAEARGEVNRRYEEAVDTTDAVTEAMERQREEAGRLARELDSAFGALNALQGVRSAQRRVVDAQQDLNEARARAGALPGEIAEAEARLARAREESARVTTREAQTIVQARQRVKSAEADLAEVTTDAEADALDREAAALALTIAQEDLAEALAESVAPTQEVEQAERDLMDLRREQEQVTRRVQEATEAVTSAQVDLVLATMELAKSSDELAGKRDQMEAFFRAIATQAGLSRAEIEKLIEQMRTAAGLAGNVAGGGSIGRLINTTTGRPAYSGPNGEPGSAAPFAGSNASWVMPDGTRVYYRTGAAPDPGNVGALNQANPASATETVFRAQPVVSLAATAATAGANAIVTELQRLANQNPDNIIIGADGRRVLPTVNIYPKTAVYDERQTAATLANLELLNR